MATIVAILTFMAMMNFTLSRIEHENSFITLVSGFATIIALGSARKHAWKLIGSVSLKHFQKAPQKIFSWLGLFLADFIAVIRLYSQCQKVSFFPNFRRKIPNLKS